MIPISSHARFPLSASCRYFSSSYFWSLTLVTVTITHTFGVRHRATR